MLTKFYAIEFFDGIVSFTTKRHFNFFRKFFNTRFFLVTHCGTRFLVTHCTAESDAGNTIIRCHSDLLVRLVILIIFATIENPHLQLTTIGDTDVTKDSGSSEPPEENLQMNWARRRQFERSQSCYGESSHEIHSMPSRSLDI